MRVGRLRSEFGTSAAEMALVLLLVVVVAFSAVQLFGFQVEDLWQNVSDGNARAGMPRPPGNQGGGGGNTGGGGSGLPGFPDPTTTTSSTTTTTTIPAP